MSYKLSWVKKNKNKRWLWTAVNHWQSGILAWVLGDRSSQTFKPLWKLIRGWQSFLYVTDGWTVYPCFINAIRPFNSQNLHDSCRRGKYPTQALSSSLET